MFLLSIYLALSVSFFAQGAVSIWLLVRNNPFSTITENVCLCWSGFHFVWSRALWFLSQGRRKRKKIQFRRSGADLCAWVFFFLFFFFLASYFVLGYSLVIVSGQQWRNSAIHIRVSILLQTPLPSRLPHNIEQSSVCSTVGPSWLSILNIAKEESMF